jgi:uncharacterized membrane protein YeiH
MDPLIHILDLIGLAVFSITGALAAGGKKMDIFGVVVLGCVTALGGGTLRDIILGSRPVFWIADLRNLLVPALAAIATFVVARRWRIPAMSLMYADAIGLAVFTVIGFQKGFELTQKYGIAIIMGVTTGVVGGIIRDVLSGEIPLIFRREIYASASLFGAALFALLSHAQLPIPFNISVSLLATLFLRFAALYWKLGLPILLLKEEGEEKPENRQ